MSMTTQPEAAMTREQMLEEALKPFARAADMADDYRTRIRQKPLRDDAPALYPFVPTIADLRRARAALASTKQEPAPAADAEDGLVTITIDCTDAIVRELKGLGFDVAEVRLWIQKLVSDSVGKVAALRRYAGDGGVTEEQVEAAHHAFWQARPALTVEGGTKPAIRAALTAARAKSGEKGGAR